MAASELGELGDQRTSNRKSDLGRLQRGAVRPRLKTGKAGRPHLFFTLRGDAGLSRDGEVQTRVSATEQGDPSAEVTEGGVSDPLSESDMLGAYKQ